MGFVAMSTFVIVTIPYIKKTSDIVGLTNYATSTIKSSVLSKLQYNDIYLYDMPYKMSLGECDKFFVVNKKDISTTSYFDRLMMRNIDEKLKLIQIVINYGKETTEEIFESCIPTETPLLNPFSIRYKNIGIDNNPGFCNYMEKHLTHYININKIDKFNITMYDNSDKIVIKVTNYHVLILFIDFTHYTNYG